MEKELGLYLLSVRFGGQFISGGVHIAFVREVYIEGLQLFGKIFGRALKKGQKFEFTHQTCRLFALDDISVVRPKKFLPTAWKMRGGTMCPPPGLIVDPIPHVF